MTEVADNTARECVALAHLVLHFCQGTGGGEFDDLITHGSTLANRILAALASIDMPARSKEVETMLRREPNDDNAGLIVALRDERNDIATNELLDGLDVHVSLQKMPGWEQGSAGDAA